MGARPRLGVLVPSGNPTVEPELYRMATLWYALRALGIKDPVRGYGRLLAGV